MKQRSILFLVPLCLLAAGCASTGLRAGDAQEQEIQALKARILELQREAAMNQVELAQLRQQIAELEARNGGPRPVAPASRPPATSDSGSRAPAKAAEPPRVATAPRTAPPAPPAAPRREPSQPAAPAPSREPIAVEPIEEMDIELPEEDPPQSPPRRMPPPSPAPSKPALPSSAMPPDEEPAPETLSPTSQVLYDRGYSLYYQGHYVDAESSFQRFLQSSPTSELADNAQYWIGECR
jgi:TolA-binding protein